MFSSALCKHLRMYRNVFSQTCVVKAHIVNAAASACDLAKLIQSKQYDDADAANWRYSYLFGKVSNQWFKVWIDHVKQNGTEAANAFVLSKELLHAAARNRNQVENIQLNSDNSIWVEKVL